MYYLLLLNVQITFHFVAYFLPHPFFPFNYIKTNTLFKLHVLHIPPFLSPFYSLYLYPYIIILPTLITYLSFSCSSPFSRSPPPPPSRVLEYTSTRKAKHLVDLWNIPVISSVILIVRILLMINKKDSVSPRLLILGT